jgi:hypothetical protein
MFVIDRIGSLGILFLPSTRAGSHIHHSVRRTREASASMAAAIRAIRQAATDRTVSRPCLALIGPDSPQIPLRVVGIQGSARVCTYKHKPVSEGPRTESFTLISFIFDQLIRSSHLYPIMEDGTKARDSDDGVDRDDQQDNRSTIRQIWTHSWFQILLISFICFCCPGVSILYGLDVADC